MKKLSLILLVFLPWVVFAMPVDQPGLAAYVREGIWIPDTSPVGVKAGYVGNFISDARLKQGSESTGRVDNFKQTVNSGEMIINFLNRADLFASLGSSRIKTNWRIRPAAGGVFRIELQSRYSFAWRAGANFILWNNEDTAIALSGGYFFAKPRISWLTSNGSPVTLTGQKISYEEGQVSLAVSHQMGIFIPYIGMKYSNVSAKVDEIASAVISSDGSGKISMKRRDPVGFFLGVSLTNGKIFAVNLEARFVDEEASTISAKLAF